MKIPPATHDVPLTKYDVPLLFAKIYRRGQLISCEDPLLITGSPAKRQGIPALDRIPHGKIIYNMLFLSCYQCSFKKDILSCMWPAIFGICNDIWYMLMIFCMWSP